MKNSFSCNVWSWSRVFLDVSPILSVFTHSKRRKGLIIIDAVGFGEAPRVITQYTALFYNILHRLRFAKFLAIVSEELDKEVGFLILD